MSESDGKTLVVIPGSEVDAPPPGGPLCGSERLHRIVLHLHPILDRAGLTSAQQGNLFGHVVGLLVEAYQAGVVEGEAGALAKLRQTTHARLAESGAIEQARKDAAEEVERRHVEALRDLCFSRGDPLPTGSVEAMDPLRLRAHLALSLDRRAKRIEELAAAALSSPLAHTEDPADARAPTGSVIVSRHGDRWCADMVGGSAWQSDSLVDAVAATLRAFDLPGMLADRERAAARAEGFACALTRVEAEADGYRRRAQAIRMEAEVPEAKADALVGVVAQIRREGAP